MPKGVRKSPEQKVREKMEEVTENTVALEDLVEDRNNLDEQIEQTRGFIRDALDEIRTMVEDVGSS